MVETPGFFVNQWNVRLRDIIPMTYVVITANIAIIVALNLQCTPHEAIWDFRVEGKCFNLFHLQVSSATIHLICDITIMLLPQRVIWKLNMGWKKKLGVSVIFSLGLLACISAAFRLASTVAYGDSPDGVYNLGPLIFWATAEMTCGFFIVCVPCVPKILRESGVLAKIKKAIGMATRSKSTNQKERPIRNAYYKLDEDGVPMKDMNRDGSESTEHLHDGPQSDSPGITRTTQIIVSETARGAHDERAQLDDDCSLWDVLSKRRNLMTDCPKSRIDSESFVTNKHHTFHGHRGHFINEDLGLFDAPFFSVTANEAAAMDPMQRWTLETTYHAFEKAGIPVESLRGSRTAVFSASMVEDYAKMIAMDPDNAERTAVTGSSVACVIPNRISWFFDLKGPSIHVNTACSSSLSAVDMACKTIHSGDATCNGDIIRAVIRSTGSNQDGHTPGLTQPSSQAQEDLIRHVYAKASLSLDQTRYVEAHGTGTAVGDPIETKAIGRSFRESRSAEEPLYIGSIKANIGHLEGASGLAGIVKCILILERGIIPPNTLLEKINPAIDSESYNITVPTKEVPWPSPGLRRASVNSFGFGGSNTHVILEDALHYLRERDLPGRHCTTDSDELGRNENINKPEYSQPLSTAIQIALVELLHSFEIRPRAVVGHSSGEIAAAYAVGGLDLESACKVSYFRGKLAGQLREASASYPGAMISINIPEDRVPDYLREALGREYVALISVACVNSPFNCTLSGPEDVIDKIKQQADKDGIFAQKLKTGVAYHSPSVMSIASEYLSLISSLNPAGSQDPKVVAHVPMVSSVTGKPVCLEELSKGEYWVDNMVCPVRFADAVQHLVQDASRLGLGSISDLVEVGPHPALRRPTLDTIKQTENQTKDIRYMNVLHRSRPAVETVLSLVGQLFSLGHSVSVSAANQQSSDDTTSFLTDCPKYPFDHSRRYWSESRISRGFRLRGAVQGETLGVDDKVLYPAAGMLVMAIEAVQQMASNDRDVAGYHVKIAEFLGLIPVQGAWEDRVETEVHLRPVDKKHMAETSGFEVAIYSYTEDKWTQSLRASIQVNCKDSPDAKQRQLSHDNVRDQFKLAQSISRPIDSHVFYGNAAENGLQYGDSFRLGQDIHWDGNYTAVMRVDVTKPRYRTSSLVHPAVFDQAFHVLRASTGQQPACNVPVRITDAWFAASGQSKGTKETERKLLHRIEWKPMLGLMDPERLRQLCRADTFSRDETAILANHAELCSTLDLVAARTLRHLDRTKVPDSLRRHVEWIEHHVSKMSPETIQASEGITDTQVEAQLSHVEEVLPAWRVYTACARSLPKILAGQVDPLQVVFGSNLADIFYADLFQYLCADGRLGTILDLAAHENPALRILEVGAGTGGMTTHVLTALQERENRTGGLSFAEYTYTDISPAFFERAMSRWPDLQSQGRLSFKTLDLDRDVEAQGFETGSYDIVVAACVLHATPDLEATIRNVRKALRPGGQLILLEVINSDDIATNFMAGLLPGWWVAREEWRPHSAAVPENLWDKCLRANGFSGNDVVIRDFKNDPCHIMSVIVSTAVEKKGEVTNLVPPQGRLILVVEDQDSKQQELAKSVLAHIDPSNSRESITCGFSMDQLSGVFKESTGSDTIICLYEVYNKPFLSALTEESFACLQLLVNEASRLLWATASGIDSPQSCQYSVAQGFLRSIRAEQTDCHIVTLTIEDNADLSAASVLIGKISRQAYGPSASKEVEYLARDGLVLTGRAVEDVTYNATLGSLLAPHLQTRKWANAEALQLSLGRNDSSETFRFVPDARHDTELEPHEVEIEAKAWGLNQQDIQVSTTGQQSMSRCDCTGTVTRVGPECDSSIQPRDRVFMMVDGGMRKYPRAKDTATVKLPDIVSFESAALALSPLIAAVHGLVNVARVRPGESILVHSADSVVGQTAVQVAQAQGARVFATASSSAESSALATTLGISNGNLLNIRDPRLTSKLLKATADIGVDVVFNSDSNQDTLRASCECLVSGGHLIQVASANVEDNNVEFMGQIPRNVTFSSIDLLGLKPSVMADVMKKALKLLADGKVQPLSKGANFSVSEVENALKHLQNSDKGCRVVLCAKDDDVVQAFTKERRSRRFEGQSSYLVAGGFGGVGRAIVRWMVDRGAKHLIIPSRSGPSSPLARQLVDELTKKGVNLMATNCDISSETGLTTLLQECAKTMPPIKGCINAAMVLQDATFQTMTFAQWDLAVRTKVQTSWNLHRLLRQDLDFFVLLSSLAGVIGQMASANYAAGCSFQDALARHRTAQGQRGLSIDIGWMRNPISASGKKANDMQQIDEAELLALLSLCCDPSSPPTTEGQLLFGLKTPADVLSQGQTPPALLDRPLFRAFAHLPGSAAKADEGSSSHDADHQAAALFHQSSDSTERTEIVLRALAAKLARAMSMSPEDIEPNKPLSNYGVDSLMAVELRSWIGRDFGAPVAISDIMGGVPIARIADVVVAKSAPENK
ncbi:hypothetical protein CEP52_008889 [Fusarium oligoseptatum]|uniref:Uncharacterized protein n=1 Tax=Fusarium oligoseptatum TaxID=2604345 RepID=A0A428TFJ8_9HYPO|nr:hypothetical protein CEP52_008889 [Fusarium oligoseptatum]